MTVHPFQPDEGVQLEQVDRKRFLLLRGFAYTDPDKERHVITPEGVGRTDLASVPSILWWFVASYGRQTRAALVHDQLVDAIERHDADWVFRKALGDSGIGFARRWLAWTAVSFETTFRTAGMGIDQVKAAAIEEQRKDDNSPAPSASRKRRRGAGVQRQRHGRLVTAVGFALVALHLAAACIVAALAGSTLAVILAVAIALSWVAAWGGWTRIGWAGLGRLASFVGGAIVIVPFTALLFIPLGVVWAMERIVWLARTFSWLVRGRRRGHPKPQPSDFGSTRAVDPHLQRL